MGIVSWITVRGNHIPIMDGESKASAVGRFIKDRRNKYNKKVIKTADMIAGGGTEDNPRHKNYPRTQEEFKQDIDDAIKYYDKNIYKPTIKGIDKDAVRKSYFPNGRQFKDISSGELITIQKYGKDKTTISIKDVDGKVRTKDVNTKELYNDYKFYDAARLNMPRNMNETATRYKLKEDKRTLSRMETAKEIKDRTLKRYNDAKAAHYDSAVDGYKLYDSGLTKALNKVRKENDKDLPKLERAIKYQGYIAADGTNKMKVYKSEKLAKELQRRRNIDDAFKAVYGVGLDEFNKTYKKKK